LSGGGEGDMPRIHRAAAPLDFRGCLRDGSSQGNMTGLCKFLGVAANPDSGRNLAMP